MSATDGEPDAYGLVEEYWPYDGPYSDERTAAAALALSRLVRYLNNATGKRSALNWAPTAAGILSNVGSAAYGLDQLFDQLQRFLSRLVDDEDSTLYDDRGDRSAAETAALLVAHLDDVRAAARTLADAVDRATQVASHLGHDS